MKRVRQRGGWAAAPLSSSSRVRPSTVAQQQQPHRFPPPVSPSFPRAPSSQSPRLASDQSTAASSFAGETSPTARARESPRLDPPPAPSIMSLRQAATRLMRGWQAAAQQQQRAFAAAAAGETIEVEVRFCGWRKEKRRTPSPLVLLSSARAPSPARAALVARARGSLRPDTTTLCAPPFRGSRRGAGARAQRER